MAGGDHCVLPEAAEGICGSHRAPESEASLDGILAESSSSLWYRVARLLYERSSQKSRNITKADQRTHYKTRKWHTGDGLQQASSGYSLVHSQVSEALVLRRGDLSAAEGGHHDGCSPRAFMIKLDFVEGFFFVY